MDSDERYLGNRPPNPERQHSYAFTPPRACSPVEVLIATPSIRQAPDSAPGNLPDGHMDGRTDGLTDGRTDGRMDGRTDGRTN